MLSFNGAVPRLHSKHWPKPDPGYPEVALIGRSNVGKSHGHGVALQTMREIDGNAVYPLNIQKTMENHQFIGKSSIYMVHFQ